MKTTAKRSKYNSPATSTPKRGSKRARFRAVQEAWRRKYELGQATRHAPPPKVFAALLLENLAAGKYDPSRSMTPQTGREVLEEKFPTAPTDIRADVDLHAQVQARWPSVTSNERGMIAHMMFLYPNISDATLRIYLGLRRGSVPRAEW